MVDFSPEKYICPTDHKKLRHLQSKYGERVHLLRLKLTTLCSEKKYLFFEVNNSEARKGSSQVYPDRVLHYFYHVFSVADFSSEKYICPTAHKQTHDTCETSTVRMHN